MAAAVLLGAFGEATEAGKKKKKHDDDDGPPPVTEPTTTEGNHTLRWDRILDSTNGDATTGCNSDRFKCIFPTAAFPDGTAVLDLETGLVWERSPQVATVDSWSGGISHCATLEVAGRKGWSLPMREHLASLVDATNTSPALPTGHPFLAVQSAGYWSTTNAANPTLAWSVFFTNGAVNNFLKDNTFLLAWCVRGGQVFDGNTHNTLH